MKAKILELEVNSDRPRNADLYFHPTKTVLRGRMVFARCAEPEAFKLQAKWGAELPGQRVRIDVSEGVAEIIEPLAEDEYADLREKLARAGLAVPKGERFEGVHLPTWLFWCRRALAGGHATIVSGDAPTDSDCKGAKRGVTGLRGEDEDDEVKQLRSELSELRRLVTSLLEKK